MKGSPLLLAAAVGTAVAAGWLWGPRALSVGGGAMRASQPASGPAASQASPRGAGVPANGLSFAAGGNPGAGAASAEAPKETAAERQRKLALRKLGYQIDARYYRMSLTQLRELAKQGNVQALTHLAERYLFQLDGHPSEPDYEAGFSYREEAREALQQAYALGNMHAAAMISESYLLERQPQEAAAWNLVARRSGDALSADWFLKTKDYQALTDQQKAAAGQRADQLMQALQQRKPA
jgi:hypothetical protein